MGLSGCASVMTDETASRAFVAPGKYSLYTCGDLAQQLKTSQTREKELEGLMAKAEQGPGGALVSALAYRTEYVQARGDQLELAKTAADKNCTPQSQAASERSVY